MTNPDFDTQKVYDLLTEYDFEMDRSRKRPRSEHAEWVALKGAGGCFLVASVGLISLKLFGDNTFIHGLVLVSVFLAWFGATSALAIPLLVALPSFRRGLKDLRYPVKKFLTPSAFIAQRDHDFSVKLASYDEASLRFIAKRMHTHAEGMRSRVGIIIGSIERVGFIPLSILFSFAVWELLPKIERGDAPITFVTLCLGSVGLVFLNFVGIIVIAASRRIDELAGIVEFAVNSKGSSKPVAPE